MIRSAGVQPAVRMFHVEHCRGTRPECSTWNNDTARNPALIVPRGTIESTHQTNREAQSRLHPARPSPLGAQGQPHLHTGNHRAPQTASHSSTLLRNRPDRAANNHTDRPPPTVVSPPERRAANHASAKQNQWPKSRRHLNQPHEPNHRSFPGPRGLQMAKTPSPHRYRTPPNVTLHPIANASHHGTLATRPNQCIQTSP